MSILLDLARRDPEAIGIMKKPYRAIVYNSLCSCGRETGVLQYEIEEGMKLRTLFEILNGMNIVLMCCRRTIMCAPQYIIVSSDKATTIIDIPMDGVQPSVTDAPKATHLPFPAMPN